MNRLKELRNDKDLLQKELAKDIGISQRNYSYYETEHTELTCGVLKKLAEYYNTSIDYILYLTDVRKPYPKSILAKNKKDNKKNEIIISEKSKENINENDKTSQ